MKSWECEKKHKSLLNVVIMCYLYVSGKTRRNRVENECVLQWYPQIHFAFIRMAKAALRYHVSGLPLCKCVRNVEWGRTCIMMPPGCLSH